MDIHGNFEFHEIFAILNLVDFHGIFMSWNFTEYSNFTIFINLFGIFMSCLDFHGILEFHDFHNFHEFFEIHGFSRNF